MFRSYILKCAPLGCRAYAAGWWMDFELIYIGAGFITPLAVNVSMMIGAILSWGIAWPLLENRAGDWYPLGLASHSFRGLFACAFLPPPATPPAAMYVTALAHMSAGAPALTHFSDRG